MSGLIWVQTVCKGYQQTTKAATCRQKVNSAWKPLLWVHFNEMLPVKTTIYVYIDRQRNKNDIIAFIGKKESF